MSVNDRVEIKTEENSPRMAEKRKGMLWRRLSDTLDKKGGSVCKTAAQLGPKTSPQRVVVWGYVILSQSSNSSCMFTEPSATVLNHFQGF
jgi:hypothetical protein